ncbi:hypothetical protein KM043_003211 [Ampulex compressa]|nr:hypothetical protein KM043_003211 [Ampulex compressa]
MGGRRCVASSFGALGISSACRGFTFSPGGRGGSRDPSGPEEVPAREYRYKSQGRTVGRGRKELEGPGEKVEERERKGETGGREGEAWARPRKSERENGRSEQLRRGERGGERTEREEQDKAGRTHASLIVGVGNVLTREPKRASWL